MRLQIVALSLAAACFGLGATNAQKPTAPPVQRPTAPTQTAVVADCLVSLIEERHVPGREPGVLVEMNVKEGTEVKAGDELAKIDDSEPQIQRKYKEIHYQTAKAKADDDVSIRFSKKSAEYGKVAYEKAIKANKIVPGVVTDIDVKEKELAWHKALLEIEKSTLDQHIAGLTADAKAAEVEGVDLSINRRKLLSPIDGVVVKVNKHVGEWVPPGDPVVRVVRVDRLRVEGFLSLEKYDPRRIQGCPVSIETKLTDEKVETFPGEVVFVSPLVEGGGEYRVWAEVANRKVAGAWLLHPGVSATMTIKLK